MEGLKQITDHISKDSELEATALLTHAREDANAKALYYQKAAEARRQQLISQGEAQGAELIRRSLSAAELEAKKCQLSVRQELVSEVFASAMKALLALPSDAYRSFLVRQAVLASSTGTEEVLLNETDKGDLGEGLVQEANRLLKEAGRPGALTLSPETRSMAGGLILKSGLIETNCTWESLIKLARDTMTGDVAKGLFDAG